MADCRQIEGLIAKPRGMEAPAPEDPDDVEHAACIDRLRTLPGRVEATVAWRMECEKLLGRLAEEQDLLLGEVRDLTAWGPLTPGAEGLGPRRSWSNLPTAGAFSANAPLTPSPTQLDETELELEEEKQKQLFSAVYHVAKNVESEKSHSQGTFMPFLRSKASSSGYDSLSVATALLQWKYFEPAMSVFILINTANIGWTIERELLNLDTSVNTGIEIALLAIFVMELVLRFRVHGRRLLWNAWGLFDFLLISLTIFVMSLASIQALEESAGSLAEAMKQMLLLRIMRLLRLVRAVRLIQMFRSLWKLVEGLKQCLGTMVSALLLMIAAMYLFACLGAELITKFYRDDEQIGSLVRDEFNSMPMIMMTLFQFVSMDGAANFYTPLVRRSPLLSFYFVLIVVSVSIALMNLITAVVVDDAISSTMMDNEMRRHYLRHKVKALKPAFRALFRSLDASGDGVVQVSEIVQAIKHGLQLPQSVQDLINPSQMLDLFEILDHDHSGELREAEFVDGLSKLAVSEVPLETLQILHLLHSTRHQVFLCKGALQTQSLERLGNLRRASLGTLGGKLGYRFRNLGDKSDKSMSSIGEAPIEEARTP